MRFLGDYGFRAIGWGVKEGENNPPKESWGDSCPRIVSQLIYLSKLDHPAKNAEPCHDRNSGLRYSS